MTTEDRLLEKINGGINKIMKPNKFVLPILLLLSVVMVSITPVSAHVEDLMWNVSGWIKDDEGTGVASAVVSNTSNTTQTATANASGGYVLSVTNNTAEIAITVSPKAGYTQNNTVKYRVAGADNGSRNITLVQITPTLSAVNEATPTLTGETLSWTVTATDGLNNNYVGNRIKYSQDSVLGMNYFYTAWSNDTAAPSFALSNLKVNTKYYYQVETYNQLDSEYDAATTGDFTTKSGTSSTYGQTPIPTKTPQNILTTITGGGMNIAILAILVIGALYLIFDNSGGKGKGKKKKGK